MEPFDRQPPRFVPTLTDVVPLGLPITKPSEDVGPAPASQEAAEQTATQEQALVGGAVAPDAMAFEVDTAPQPAEEVPQQVPTAQPRHAAAADVPPPAAAAGTASPEPMALAITAAELHQMLVQRILERVQPVLEAQLQEVVANVVLAHAEAMVHHLQNAVEEVVHHAVVDALEQEQLQSNLQFLDDEIPPLG